MKNKKFMSLVGVISLSFALTACQSEPDEDYMTDTEEVDDSSYDSTINSSTEPSSSYTEEELELDPTAPSDDPTDYNSDGEFVPSDGPTDDPADYNIDGEYKPVEDMTQDEIEAELLEMLGE